MLRNLLHATAITAALVLTGCQGAGGDVSVLSSSSVAPRPGASYAWAPVSNSGDPRVANDIVDQRIRAAIDSALAAKGYRQVSDPASADLTVTYHVALQDRTEIRADTFGADPVYCGLRGCFGGWGYYGAPTTTIRNIDYTEGTLLLDITDRASGQLAWRATSQRRVDQSDSDQASLNAIVLDMTQSLPGVAAAVS